MVATKTGLSHDKLIGKHQFAPFFVADAEPVVKLEGKNVEGNRLAKRQGLCACDPVHIFPHRVPLV